MATSFVLYTLNQAVKLRRSVKGELIHHSDRGIQYLSFRHSARLAVAGAKTSLGSADDNCDNALAESVIGLFKTETTSHLDWETLKRSHWYDNERLHGAIGHQTPNEAEQTFHQQTKNLDLAAWPSNKHTAERADAIQHSLSPKYRK